MFETAVKTAFFLVFVAILYFVIDFVIDYYKVYIAIGVPNNINFLLCSLGFYNAFNLLVSMLVGNWIVNRIISYISY